MSSIYGLHMSGEVDHEEVCFEGVRGGLGGS